jgi:hypothetical protein
LSRIITLAVVGLALTLSGCAVATHTSETSRAIFYPHKNAETLTQTSEEHRQMVRAVAERDSKGLIDDLDVLFMTDRPTRLTRWHTK